MVCMFVSIVQMIATYDVCVTDWLVMWMYCAKTMDGLRCLLVQGSAMANANATQGSNTHEDGNLAKTTWQTGPPVHARPVGCVAQW